MMKGAYKNLFTRWPILFNEVFILITFLCHKQTILGIFSLNKDFYANIISFSANKVQVWNQFSLLRNKVFNVLNVGLNPHCVLNPVRTSLRNWDLSGQVVIQKYLFLFYNSFKIL